MARARAETGVTMAGAASSPAATARRGARSALATSRRRPAEVSARPPTPPPTSSASPPRTPHPCADALQPSFAGGSETKAHCREQCCGFCGRSRYSAAWTGLIRI